MQSPLSYDEAIKKEFNIKNEFELEPELRLGFVRTQLDEIKKFLQRERVELILAEAQAASDVEAIAAEAKTKVAAHRNTIKGIVASISILSQFVDELKDTVA
jgi:hypothetical protein